MARRGPKRDRDLPDYHLWVEVKRSVTPLRVQQDEAAPAPALPLPPKPHAPTRVTLSEPLVIGARSTPPAPYPKQMPPGRVIEPGVKRRVVRGQIAIDGRIDLHGMRQDEAREALGRFIRSRHAEGGRTVLVITGKGARRGLTQGPERSEPGVLKAMLPRWLAEPDLSPMIAGHDVAARGHGGDGAFYVRLRRGPS